MALINYQNHSVLSNYRVSRAFSGSGAVRKPHLPGLGGPKLDEKTENCMALINYISVLTHVTIYAKLTPHN